MNLIYCCAFFNPGYITLAEMLLLSLSAYGNVGGDTEVLIITSSEFKPVFQESLKTAPFKIHYYLLNITTSFGAACARLHIFRYPQIKKYSKILYVDTDILVNSDINTLLKLPISSKQLYAVREGQIGIQSCFGKIFFDFKKFSRHQSAFNSGILLFMNSASMRSLFSDINNHIDEFITAKLALHPDVTDYMKFVFADQPFIVYNAISQKKYNNVLLNQYACLKSPQYNPHQLCSTSDIVDPNIILYHFIGPYGDAETKYGVMMDFWDKMNKARNENAIPLGLVSVVSDV